MSKNQQRHIQNVNEKLYKYVVTPRWQKGSSVNYTNNNAESQKHVLKIFSNWNSSQASDLVDKFKNTCHDSIQRYGEISERVGKFQTGSIQCSENPMAEIFQKG